MNPLNCPAGDVLTTEYTGTGRAPDPAALTPVRAAAPVSASPPRGTGLSPATATSSRSAAAGDPKTPPGAGRRRAAGAAPGGLHKIAAAMSEDRGPDSLDAHVRRICRDLGLLRYHTHDARRSPAGFPDLVIVGSRTLFRELKTQRGKVSAAQQEWLDALTGAGDDAGVWRPEDLLSRRIARELAAISLYRAATA